MSTYIIDFLFYLFILAIGLDLTVSGVMLLKSKGTLIKARFLGVRIIYWLQSEYEKLRQKGKLTRMIYSVKGLSISALYSGILLSIIGLLGIIQGLINSLK
jgi:hypothetical protein